MCGICLGQQDFSYVPRLPGWSFQQLICGGVLPPPAVPLGYARGQGFPPLIRCKKTAPSHQSLQKSPALPKKALEEAATFICPL